jgi:hypothetical protein
MTRQGFARQGSARRTRKLRSIVSPVFGLTLCGFALTLVGVAGTPSPAVAFGGMGFGHMGGFGGMGMGRSMGPSMRTPMMTPRRGTGTYIARPPGGTKGNAGNGDGNRWPPRHPVIGHPIIVPIPGGGTPPAAIFRRHRRPARPASMAAEAGEVAAAAPLAEPAAACRHAASGASCPTR